MAPRRQIVSVETGSSDEYGYLFFADGKLVAVVVQLDDQIHGSDRGAWHLEAGFGPCATKTAPLFRTIEEAEAWVQSTLPVTNPASA
jgi:hypothetical protein